MLGIEPGQRKDRTMTKEEFLKLVNDYVRGQLCHSNNYSYTCFNMMTKKYRESDRMEICVLFKPYKAENSEEKEVKKTLVRNCDVFLTHKDRCEAYAKYVKWNAIENFNDNTLALSPLDYEDWIFAEYNPKFYAD